jgi:hypothetical protein
MKLFEKLQTLMAAAAFAEEGDRRTAIEFAAEAMAPTPATRETCAPIGPLAVNHGK